VSKFAKEVAPSELLIGNTVTAGVNKLLVPGDGSWQRVATTEHAYFSLRSFSSRTLAWGIPLTT